MLKIDWVSYAEVKKESQSGAQASPEAGFNELRVSVQLVITIQASLMFRWQWREATGATLPQI